MDLKLIRNLVRLMERGEVTELEIDDEKAGLRIHLKRGPGAEGGSGASVVMLPGAPAHAPLTPYPPAAVELEDDDDAGLPPGTIEITSPMVGTFYRSSSPESDPFIGTGSKVEEDDVICIIEAMKVMNEIKAETAGEIVEILVENGEPVEFGQPLFLVKTH